MIINDIIFGVILENLVVVFEVSVEELVSLVLLEFVFIFEFEVECKVIVMEIYVLELVVY